MPTTDPKDWRLAGRLDDLPDVIAGPIVRQVSVRSATVWLAFHKPTLVSLSLFADPNHLDDPIAVSPITPTVPVGRRLHLVAVTATLPADRPDMGSGHNYYYDVHVADGRTLGSLGILSHDPDPQRRLATITFGSEPLPSFVLPHANLGRLRILHGSCRRPHADEPDAFAAVHHLIASSYADQTDEETWALTRPQLLFLTGDQIYADDVADSVLAMCTDFGDTLLGWTERLPYQDYTPVDFQPGTREATITAIAKFTGAYNNTPEKAKSHLMGFGEYVTMYLLVWSPVLWPQTMPVIGTFYDEMERERVQLLRQTLPHVRRAMANIATYMIFDDHEATDDWNLNREWCRRIWGTVGDPEGSPLGRRIVINGMLANALFQSWGNTPERFAEGTAGARILAAVPLWDGQPGSQSMHDMMAELLGAPTGPLPSGGVDVLPRRLDALTYDYQLRWPGREFEVLVTDPRTFRAFDPGPVAPPAVLSDAAIASQLPTPDQPPYLTIVIAGGPVLGVPWVEKAQEESKGLDIWLNDAEAWGLRPKTLHRFLGQLTHRPRVLILSGDVHYGFNIHLSAWNQQPYGTQTPLSQPLRSEIAQLTASAFKNETNSKWILDKTTDRLQGGGWDVLPGGIPYKAYLKFNPIDEAGWNQPLRYPDQWNAGGHHLHEKDFFHSPALLKTNEPDELYHYFVPEHWRYRFRYLNGRRSDEHPEPTPMDRPPARSPKSFVAEWFNAVGNAIVNVRRGDDGTQLVGNNNLGEVRFARDSTAANPALKVKHVIWWLMTETGEPRYNTTFDLTLNPTDDAAVPPTYVRQQS